MIDDLLDHPAARPELGLLHPLFIKIIKAQITISIMIYFTWSHNTKMSEFFKLSSRECKICKMVFITKHLALLLGAIRVAEFKPFCHDHELPGN